MKRSTILIHLFQLVMCIASSAVFAEEADEQFASHLIKFDNEVSTLPDSASMVSFGEFQRLVSSGAAVQFTSAEIQRERLAQAALDKANEKLISDFLNKNPEFTNLLQIDENKTQDEGRAKQLSDGSWQFTIAGLSHPLVMPGRSSVLSDIAYSIKTSTDPVAQLALYTSLYNALPATYFDGSVPLPPTPRQLSNATLADIQGALSTLNLAWKTVIKQIHTIPEGVRPTACDREVGVGPNNLNYGDRTSNTFACNVPSADGLFANYTFNGKGNLTCVKEQGNRGSCYAFASVSAMEQSISRTYREKVNLSEQDVIANYRTKWSPRLFGSGGSMYEVLEGAREHDYFFLFENQWPWNPSWNRHVKQLIVNGKVDVAYYTNSCDNYPSSDTCSDTEPQGLDICASDDKGNRYCAVVAPVQNASSPYVVPAQSKSLWDFSDINKSLDTTISALAAGQSVIFSIIPTQRFMDLKSPGYMTTFRGGETSGNFLYSPLADFFANKIKEGHVFHVVGYISNEQLKTILPAAPRAVGSGYFIIKNSWGTCWGDAGYGYIDSDYLGAVTTGAISLPDH